VYLTVLVIPSEVACRAVALCEGLEESLKENNETPAFAKLRRDRRMTNQSTNQSSRSGMPFFVIRH
jgi:hypothetical protein